MDTTVKQLEVEATRLRSRLIANARALISGLDYVVARLEDEDDGSINSLGHFQGEGSRFDILCAEYEMTKRHLKMLRSALA
jgi:hypothetical protein